MQTNRKLKLKPGQKLCVACGGFGEIPRGGPPCLHCDHTGIEPPPRPVPVYGDPLSGAMLCSGCDKPVGTDHFIEIDYGRLRTRTGGGAHGVTMAHKTGRVFCVDCTSVDAKRGQGSLLS